MTAATATAAELGIRPTADRFYAARAEGRYRVIDGDLIDARQDGDAPGTAYVATLSTRAKAEAKAAKLNEEHAAAVAAVVARRVAEVEAIADAAEPEGLLEVVTLDGEDAALEVTPTSELTGELRETEHGARYLTAEEVAAEKESAASVLAEAVATGRVSFDAAASALLSGVSLEAAAAIAAPAPAEQADAIAAAAAEILAVASANAAVKAAKPAKGQAAKPAAGHRISWFVYVDGERVRYATSMTGDLPAWDLTCTCGWDSQTGGASKGQVRKLMAAHKAEAASA